VVKGGLLATKRECVAKAAHLEAEQVDSGMNLSELKSRVRMAHRPIILVGNPNVGKSVVFKNLTGQRVHISNYPGTTVEISRGRARLNGDETELFDTPGINDLAQRSEDARVTLEIIEQHPEAVLVQIADAKNLRRALLLTLQLAELGRPLVLVLNMMDELQRCGARIDVDELSEILGVPVVSTIAVHNSGMDRVIEALPVARKLELVCRYEEKFKEDFERNHARLARANEVLSQTYSLEQPKRPSFGVRLGFWAMHPLKGLGVLAALLIFVFWFVGLFGAGTLVDLLEIGIFQQRVNPAAIRGVDAVLPFPHVHALEETSNVIAIPMTPAHDIPLVNSNRSVIGTAYSLLPATRLTWWQHILRFIHDFLVGEYGVVTMALSYAFAIVLPIVTTFFLTFSILEDSGYLPRLSIMVNRIFRAMGLSGKAVLPMVLGLGCDTMATMTTRILDSRRDRIITSLLLALAVPCSAQLGVLLAMMTRLSLAAALFWMALMIGVMMAVGWLTSKLFGGESSDFILEIPPMRRPQISNVLAKTFSRLEWYLKEIIPLFVLGTAILFMLDRLNLMDWMTALGRPLVTGWLGLPEQTMGAFLIGFMRRDFGAVYLLDAATGPNPLLDPHQILVAMVTITLFMPCVANLFMIAKEHGGKVAASMLAFIIPFAFLVGGLVHHVGRAVGL
jgi:ferrous iron transport protein B